MRKIKVNKNRVLMYIFTFLFILLCAGISTGGTFYNYLLEFNKTSDKSSGAVKPQQVEGKNPVNILIMGLDMGTLGTKNETNSRRTDTILLLNYNPKNKSANIISVPRDTLIKINGKNQKINAANAFGGAPYLIESIEQLLDLKVNYYGKVNYEGFRQIIDIIGGIELTINSRMDYDDDVQNLHINFKKGELVHLNGKKAEEFFRWRKNNDGTGLADGDLGRIENQQIFIAKVLEKFKSGATLLKVPEILRVLPRYAETNMTPKEIVKYGVELTTLSKEDIKMTTLQGDLAYIDSVSYVIYDEKKNKNLLQVLHDSVVAK